MRGSAPSVYADPLPPRFMVRSLNNAKGLKPRPARAWRKITGPAESSLMRMAAKTSSGRVSASRTQEHTISNVRLNTRPPRQLEKCGPVDRQIGSANKEAMCSTALKPMRWGETPAGGHCARPASFPPPEYLPLVTTQINLDSGFSAGDK